MTTATAKPAPATPAAPAELPLRAELLLVRLLVPTKKPPALSAARKSLDPCFLRPPTADEWADAAQQLRAAGLLDPKKLLLTVEGRERALAFLGVDELPARVKWQTVQGRYLVPKALGLAPSESTQKKVANADGLAALLLKRKLGLTTGSTLPQVLTAIVCRELGIPGASNWDEVQLAVLSKMLGSSERLPKETVNKVLPAKLLNAHGNGVAGLRRAVLTEFTDRTKQSAGTTSNGDGRGEEHFDLQTFANTVLAAARACPTGRFGDNKVFINHLCRYLQNEPGFPRLALEEFKRRLTEANAARLLVLSRADMAPDLPQDDVRASETSYLNAHFHFVTLEEVRP
jgi:hypothetical protein